MRPSKTQVQDWHSSYVADNDEPGNGYVQQVTLVIKRGAERITMFQVGRNATHFVWLGHDSQGRCWYSTCYMGDSAWLNPARHIRRNAFVADRVDYIGHH